MSFSTACQSAALSTGLSSTARSSSAQLVQQFKPPKSFKFPKRKFGKKGEERAFRAVWCEKYDWLHYVLVQMLLFVTFVCELNMKRSS